MTHAQSNLMSFDVSGERSSILYVTKIDLSSGSCQAVCLDRENFLIMTQFLNLML